jgi:hypothetical protein
MSTKVKIYIGYFFTVLILFTISSILLVKWLNKEQAHLTLQAVQQGPKARPLTGLALKPGLTLQTWAENPSYIEVRLETGVKKDQGVYSLITMTEKPSCAVNTTGRNHEEYAPYSPYDQLIAATTVCVDQAYISKIQTSTPKGQWKDARNDILDMEYSMKKLDLVYNGKEYQYLAAALEPCTSATKCSSGVKVQSGAEQPFTMAPYIDDVQEPITYYFKDSI